MNGAAATAILLAVLFVVGGVQIETESTSVSARLALLRVNITPEHRQ